MYHENPRGDDKQRTQISLHFLTGSSPTARVKVVRNSSTVDNCFERIAPAILTGDNFFERIARAVPTDDIFFQRVARAVRTDDNPSPTDSLSRSKR